jgi:hypothetical protein
MLGATGQINLSRRLPCSRRSPPNPDIFPVIDVLNLALPYFGLIFIGFACGKAKGLPETGLAWMNFFLLYVSLPAVSCRRRRFPN